MRPSAGMSQRAAMPGRGSSVSGALAVRPSNSSTSVREAYTPVLIPGSRYSGSGPTLNRETLPSGGCTLPKYSLRLHALMSRTAQITKMAGKMERRTAWPQGDLLTTLLLGLFLVFLPMVVNPQLVDGILLRWAGAKSAHVGL